MRHGSLDTQRKGKILVAFGPCVPFTGHCRVSKLTLQKLIFEHQVENRTKMQEKND